MRQNINESFLNGEVVERTVVDWTIADYDSAIASAPDDLQALLDERAVLLGNEAMTARIDQVADAKRMELLGDVTRAFEYTKAEEGAEKYKAAGFEGDVPDDVMSWAIAAKMTPKEAADDILKEAWLFNQARSGIRALRLQGKQTVKSASTPEQAQAAYFATISAISRIGG